LELDGIKATVNELKNNMKELEDNARDLKNKMETC